MMRHFRAAVLPELEDAQAVVKFVIEVRYGDDCGGDFQERPAVPVQQLLAD